MTRSQSGKAYRDWLDRRKAEDARNAKIAQEEQATRWHKFQRDEGHISDVRFQRVATLSDQHAKQLRIARSGRKCPCGENVGSPTWIRTLIYAWGESSVQTYRITLARE